MKLHLKKKLLWHVQRLWQLLHSERRCAHLKKYSMLCPPKYGGGPKSLSENLTNSILAYPICNYSAESMIQQTKRLAILCKLLLISCRPASEYLTADLFALITLLDLLAFLLCFFLLLLLLLSLPLRLLLCCLALVTLSLLAFDAVVNG